MKLKKKISALIKLLEADLPSLSSENTYLETLEQADGETAKKREAFDAFREKVHRQDGIYEENKIHLQDQCKEREKRDRGAAGEDPPSGIEYPCVPGGGGKCPE